MEGDLTPAMVEFNWGQNDSTLQKMACEKVNILMM